MWCDVRGRAPRGGAWAEELMPMDREKIFDNKCKYDISLGAAFLNMKGLDINYSTGEIEWYGNTLPMQEPWDMDNKDFLHIYRSYLLNLNYA